MSTFDWYSSQTFGHTYHFLHCRIIVKTSKLWYNNKKLLKQIKVCLEQLILHLRFFKVPTLCLDDSFAHAWHSLIQLHECFSNSLEGVPTYAEHLLAALPSLCGPTHPKPSQLGWGQVIVEARSSDAALHHSPSWSNSPYTAWRCVLGHCPTKRKPDGMVY